MKPASDSVSYTLLDPEALVAATVEKGGHTTPVWIQSRWSEGEYAKYIINNGCGHCCVAMALSLHGHAVTPHDEFTHCREIWGVPDEVEIFPWLSLAGVVASLASYGVSAKAFANGGGEEAIRAATEHIRASLAEGRLVIFCSAPLRESNPFSKGLHYVLFVGLDKRGDVIVANSSLRANPKTAGVQVVPLSAVAEAMRPEGCLLRADLRWGLRGHYPTGYIVVK